MKKLGTRAVLLVTEPGSDALCVHCEQRVKFEARKRNRRVVANIYKGARWNRVEQFHEDCYHDAGDPYGPLDTSRADRKFGRG